MRNRCTPFISVLGLAGEELLVETGFLTGRLGVPADPPGQIRLGDGSRTWLRIGSAIEWVEKRLRAATWAANYERSGIWSGIVARFDQRNLESTLAYLRAAGHQPAESSPAILFFHQELSGPRSGEAAKPMCEGA